MSNKSLLKKWSIEDLTLRVPKANPNIELGKFYNGSDYMVLLFVSGKIIVNIQILEYAGTPTEVILYFKSGDKLHIIGNPKHMSIIGIDGGNLNRLIGRKILPIKNTSRVSQCDDGVKRTTICTSISTASDTVTFKWMGLNDECGVVKFKYHDVSEKTIHEY